MKKHVLMILAIAALVAGGAYAQYVGDIVQVGGSNYRVTEAGGGRLVLQIEENRYDARHVPQRGGAPVHSRGGAVQDAAEIAGRWRGNAVSGLVGRAEITISGNGGTLFVYGGSGYGATNPHIRTGSPVIRNIYGTANNTWACDFLAYNGQAGNNPNPRNFDAQANSVSWQRATISISGTNTLIITVGNAAYGFDKR